MAIGIRVALMALMPGAPMYRVSVDPLGYVGLDRFSLSVLQPKSNAVADADAARLPCRLPFIAVKGPELLNKYIGASESAVRFCCNLNGSGIAFGCLR
eukprot:5189972-Pleurochrysis_carterae.AAC.2